MPSCAWSSILPGRTEHVRFPQQHHPQHYRTTKNNAMKIESLPVSPDAIPTARRRPARKAALALLALALAGAGGYAWLHRGAQPAAPAAAAAAAKPKDPVFELAPRDVALVAARPLAVTLPLSGSLTPLAQATVKSKVSGVVLATTVQEGMQVREGEVIARLDGAEARARVAQQEAQLADANARLALAQKNQANSAALLKQNYIAQHAYDTSSNAVDLAQAAVDAARAQLQLARIALDDTAIRAPLAGVVSKRYAQAGEKLAPDSPVFAIVDLKHLTLDAQVPASDIPRIKVGQDVTFRVDGFGGRDFAGKVVRINPATETGSRAMLVYIGVDNPDGVLRAGMFAKGSVVTEKSVARPLLPISALRQEGGRDVVYRVADGKVVSQPVTLGLRNADEGLVEALGGVDAGAAVLALPLDGVKPGSLVKMPPAATAANEVPAQKKG
jgi:membrane fusion protein, multidrug efflux system